MDRRDVLMAGSRLFAANLLSSPANAATAGSATAPAPRPALRTVRVRDVVIGEGRVKTIVPITGGSADEAIAQAKVIGASADTDAVELRVDFLDIAFDPAKLAALGPKVAAQLNGKPLIVTFRTKAEGGNTAIADADYAALYETLLRRSSPT
jgi:3-dehydroquinate dehydratase I